MPTPGWLRGVVAATARPLPRRTRRGPPHHLGDTTDVDVRRRRPAARHPYPAPRGPLRVHTGGRRARLLRDHPRCGGGQRRSAGDPAGAGRRHRRAAVGGGRVHPDVRRRAAVGGGGERPGRRAPGVRGRRGAVRRGLGGLRPGAEPGRAGHRPVRAGRGGRGDGASLDGVDRPGVPAAREAGAGGGGVGDGRRGRLLGRPGGGRSADPGLLAVDLLCEPAGRRGRAGPGGLCAAVGALHGAVRLGGPGHGDPGHGWADLRGDRGRHRRVRRAPGGGRVCGGGAGAGRFLGRPGRWGRIRWCRWTCSGPAL